MGIKTVIVDEKGNRSLSVEDPTNILHRVLPSYDDPDFHYLNRIDWYGDTTFNRMQMKDVREEFEKVVKTVKAPEELSLLNKIMEFIANIEDEPHQYLKFIGD
jgi:hypothetical protein